MPKTIQKPIKEPVESRTKTNRIRINFDCSYHLTIGDKIHHGVYKKDDILTVDLDLKIPLEKHKISPFIEAQIINNKQGEYINGPN